MRLRSLPVLSYIENIYNDARNTELSSACRPIHKKNILYLAKYINNFGGIETRILAYAEALSKINCNVIFVSEQNDCDTIKSRFTCLRINFHARNFEKSLIKIIRNYHIDIVEFQTRSRRFIYALDLDELKRHCRIGCCIHGEIPAIDIDTLNSMDYRIFISDLLCSIDYDKLNDYKILPNAIRCTGREWEYNNQTKALIISRIAKDKFNQLCSAIEYCFERKIPFTIAGSTKYDNTAKRLKKRYDLGDETFTGNEIDTISYPKKHKEDYLLVAGVGQVLLEAGALGYPCLLVSDLGPGYSTFLTRKNIRGNFGRNLTLTYFSKSKQHLQVQELDTSVISDYDISQELRQDYNMADRIHEYIAYISGE